jgi:hypothetical protein
MVDMTTPFVWFHNGREKPADSVAFYEKLLGWKGSDGPPGMTMLARGDGSRASGHPDPRIARSLRRGLAYVAKGARRGGPAGPPALDLQVSPEREQRIRRGRVRRPEESPE